MAEHKYQVAKRKMPSGYVYRPLNIRLRRVARKPKRRNYPVTKSISHGFPKILKMALMTELNANDTTVNGFKDLVFYPASINDPFGTASAVQPRLHDTLDDLYNQYVVEWVKLEVWATCDSDGHNANRMALYWDTSANTATQFDQAACMPNSIVVQLDNASIDGFYGPTKKITTPKIYTQSVLNLPLYGSDVNGAMNSNPTKMWYFHLVFYDEEAASLNIRYMVKMTQYTHLYEPKPGALG